MAIRYDPALTAGLVREIRSRWIGRRVAGLRLMRESREAWLLLQDGPEEEKAIGFLLHPARGFIVARRGIPRFGGRERRIDFRRLFLTAARSPEDERLLVLEMAGGQREARPELPPVYRLFVELHTNQWNAVLARGTDDRIEAVLWSRSAGGRSLQTGTQYERPEGARRFATDPPDQGEWLGLLRDVSPSKRRATLLASMAWSSALNVDWILGDASTDRPPDETLPAAWERYMRIRDSAGADEAWLLPRDAVDQPYPVALDPAARRFGSLLEAMGAAATECPASPAADPADAGADPGSEATPEAERLDARLRDRILALKKRRAALQRQLGGESAEQLRDLGNLLLARRNDVPKGAESVSLEGFDGEPIEISLDPRFDAVRNAEKYYDQARRRERAARALPDRLNRTTKGIARLKEGRVALRAGGPSDALWDLAGGRPADDRWRRGPGRPARDETLPYRRFRSSGGLEIRVGRSSRANDALTFRHSAPEDIWLHARQAAGAHVILRWERRDQNPPHADLTEAAVLAALHSEARHSGLVAVDWTRRKYVRKPRKAAPGTVVPERVSTLFVEPDPAAASRLDPDD